MIDLSELANVSDLLTLQGAEVLGDSAVLEVDDTGERLIEQRTDRGNGEVTGFSLYQVSIFMPIRPETVNTHSKSVNHSLEAHVDLAATDDLSDIGGVVGLKESNLEALILEVTLGLSEVQGGVVRRSMPLQVSKVLNRVRPCNCYQLVRKVILSVAILIKYHEAIASLR